MSLTIKNSFFSLKSLKSALPTTPLCLHGTDGLTGSLFRSCISAGVSKVNVNSGPREGYVANLRSGLRELPLPDAIEDATSCFAWECERLMDELGSTGRAD